MRRSLICQIENGKKLPRSNRVSDLLAVQAVVATICVNFIGDGSDTSPSYIFRERSANDKFPGVLLRARLQPPLPSNQADCLQMPSKYSHMHICIIQPMADCFLGYDFCG